jgi:hypothetical protein
MTQAICDDAVHEAFTSADAGTQMERRRHDVKVMARMDELKRRDAWRTLVKERTSTARPCALVVTT